MKDNAHSVSSDRILSLLADFFVPMVPAEWQNAIQALAKAEIKRREGRSCIVCTSLLENEEPTPPHCIDCRPTDEQVADWLDHVGWVSEIQSDEQDRKP